jgi:hypothetical protein
MPQPMLDAFDRLPGVALVPMPVEGFGHSPSWTMRLPDRSSGSASPRFSRQGGPGRLHRAHDDAGVRAADEARRSVGFQAFAELSNIAFSIALRAVPVVMAER